MVIDGDFVQADLQVAVVVVDRLSRYPPQCRLVPLPSLLVDPLQLRHPVADDLQLLVDLLIDLDWTGDSLHAGRQAPCLSDASREDLDDRLTLSRIV